MTETAERKNGRAYRAAAAVLAAFLCFFSCAARAADEEKETDAPTLAEYTDEERYQYLFGTEKTLWTTDNKPKGYRTKEQAQNHMTKVTVKVWKLGSRGRKISGKKTLYVNRLLAKEVREIFSEIYELPERFPIDTLVGFRWNKKGEVSGPLLNGVTCMSAHAYGAAIDINMYQNDYYVGAGNDCRDASSPYYITEDVIAVFERHGWHWGGEFSICSDTMHFQYTGLDSLSYNNGSPFTAYSVTTPNMRGTQVKNIQRRLKKLGFSCGTDGIYGQRTADAVAAFRAQNGLDADGGTDEAFYALLYNGTPTMYD